MSTTKPSPDPDDIRAALRLRMQGMSLGPAEILVVLLVGLLVLGPQKLPEAGRQLAKGLAQFKRFQSSLHEELLNVVDSDPPSEGGTFT